LYADANGHPKVESMTEIIIFLQKPDCSGRHFGCLQSAIKLVSPLFVDVGKLQKL